MASRDLTRSHAGVAQIFFNMGSVVGIGMLMDRVKSAHVVAAGCVHEVRVDAGFGDAIMMPRRGHVAGGGLHD
ncbi:hypothetical protein DIE21_15325 [Burkholderia sp. Bp9140]|nr:hypothetical protein DIE21_15325 [Burkholderia sp. Bp9140]